MERSTISPEPRPMVYERSEAPASDSSPDEASPEKTDSSTEEVHVPQEGKPAERPEEDSEELTLKADLESVPKHARSEVQKWVEKFEKDFKGAYTKKTQDLATKRKAEEIRLSQAEAELAQWRQISQEVLKDPSKLDVYRKLYGIQDPTPAAVAPPTIRTVEDLLAFNQQTLQQQREQIAHESEMKMRNLLEQTQKYNRWDTALNSMRADPKFVKYEKVVTNLLNDQTYKTMYKGNNELEVLQQGFKDFKAMIREDLAEKEQTTIKSMKAKSKVSTVQPKTKTVPTEGSPAASKEDVIRKARARLGEL